MNDVIYECVVTTVSPDGTPHVAPMGVRYRGDRVVLMPFVPSTTLANITATHHAVLNIVLDTRVFAGCVTGRKDWPTRPAERIAGVRLAGALSHVELRLESVSDDPQRPVLTLARVHEVQHAPFVGFNRAQAAVIEGAVLVSRLHMLPPEKIDTEMAYLQTAIGKTAGPEEHEAWGWLQDAVARHRAAPPVARASGGPGAGSLPSRPTIAPGVRPTDPSDQGLT
jgi:hypothetical protein